MQELLDEILRKMFSYSGIDYSREYVKQENWFMNYEWTREQYYDFKYWFTRKMHDDWKNMKKLMNRAKKKKIDRFVDEFIFTYGWKNKEVL
jgi:hypothetical protein